MPSTPAVRIAEPLLGGPDGSRLSAAGARFRRWQATILAAVLGSTTLLALLLQGPCMTNGYEGPEARLRMCSGPLSTAFLGQLNPEIPGRGVGGESTLSALDARFVSVIHALTGDVTVFMAFSLLLGVIAVAAIGVGLLVLARQRAWLMGLFASPVILFTLGSTLDLPAVALALWAVILVLGPSPVRPVPWLSGILLAIAAFIDPLALLVLLGLFLSSLWPIRDRRGTPAAPASSDGPSQPAGDHREPTHPTGAGRAPELLVAGATVTSALLLVIDGTAVDRVTRWLGQGIDGGSFASVLVMARLGDPGMLSFVWTVAGAACILGVTAALVAVRGRGLDPAVTIGVLLGAGMIFSPGLMPWQTLWLLPFLVLSVTRWWPLIAWSVAEAGFALAVQLYDVAGYGTDKGLDAAPFALMTLVRLFVLVTVVIMAAENLHRRRVRSGVAKTTIATT